MAWLVTALSASHSNSEQISLRNAAVSAFAWEGSGLADVHLEQSGFRRAELLHSVPQLSCSISINCPNRMLGGPRKFGCVCTCSFGSSPAPVRGKPARWGGHSLFDSLSCLLAGCGYIILHARAFSFNAAHIFEKLSLSCAR